MFRLVCVLAVAIVGVSSSASRASEISLICSPVPMPGFNGSPFAVLIDTDLKQIKDDTLQFREGHNGPAEPNGLGGQPYVQFGDEITYNFIADNLVARTIDLHTGAYTVSGITTAYCSVAPRRQF